jgi:hypothetical protein
MVAFDPARRIGDQRETGSMALRKPVGTKTFDLLEGAFSEVLRVAVGDHAVDHLRMEFRDAACHLERRHASAQRIRLRRGKTGADDRHLHRLLLEERYTKRLAEHALQFRRRIVDLVLALAPAQIGMHHVALDRVGPHDRDFNDEVIERRRLQPRQHRHLRAALDLERAECVGLADHRIGGRVFRRDSRKIETLSAMPVEQVEGPTQAAEHSGTVQTLGNSCRFGKG